MIGLIHPFDISARPSRARAGRSALWTLACSLLFFAGCRKEETVAINLPAEKSAPPSLTPEAAHAGLTLPNRPGLYLALGDKTVELPKGGRPIRSGGEVQIVFYDKNAAKYGNWNLRRYSVNAETKERDLQSSSTCEVKPVPGLPNVIEIVMDHRLDPALYSVTGHAVEASAEAETKLEDVTREFVVEIEAMRAARAALAEDEIDALLQNSEKAIGEDPKNADAYLLRAEAYLNKKDWDKSLADASKALELDTESREAGALIAQIHYSRGDHDSAIAAATAAIAKDAENGELYYLRARARWAKRDFAEILSDTNKALELNPKLASCWGFRANLHLANGDMDQALADAGEAIRLDPKFAYAYKIRASAYRAKKNFEGALADAGKAIEINPADDSAYAARAIILAKQGRVDEAIADLVKATEMQPENSNYVSLRAWAHRMKGENDLAMTDYQKAAELNPNNPFAWSGRVSILIAKGSKEEALSMAEKGAAAAANANEATRADILACKAEALSAMGRQDEARALLKDAQSLSADGEEVLRVSGILNAPAQK